ncbi:DUF3040 domain-containing protein [Amycolatopsis sp. NPDC059090]|uniref:DUF3040 domain-containing protein n=1 Tax=unclassified Amycolatopsis TaxID=2618356 RepID=UPI00366A9DCA
MGPHRQPDPRRALRSMERDLLATDALWVRRAFGEKAWPLRRVWPVACWALTAIAAGLVACGIAFPPEVPLALLGFVLAAVAVCGHVARQECLRPPARRTPGPGKGFPCRPSQS